MSSSSAAKPAAAARAAAAANASRMRSIARLVELGRASAGRGP